MLSESENPNDIFEWLTKCDETNKQKKIDATNPSFTNLASTYNSSSLPSVVSITNGDQLIHIDLTSLDDHNKLPKGIVESTDISTQKNTLSTTLEAIEETAQDGIFQIEETVLCVPLKCNHDQSTQQVTLGREDLINKSSRINEETNEFNPTSQSDSSSGKLKRKSPTRLPATETRTGLRTVAERNAAKNNKEKEKLKEELDLLPARNKARAQKATSKSEKLKDLERDLKRQENINKLATLKLFLSNKEKLNNNSNNNNNIITAGKGTSNSNSTDDVLKQPHINVNTNKAIGNTPTSSLHICLIPSSSSNSSNSNNISSSSSSSVPPNQTIPIPNPSCPELSQTTLNIESQSIDDTNNILSHLTYPLDISNYYNEVANRHNNSLFPGVFNNPGCSNHQSSSMMTQSNSFGPLESGLVDFGLAQQQQSAHMVTPQKMVGFDDMLRLQRKYQREIDNLNLELSILKGKREEDTRIAKEDFRTAKERHEDIERNLRNANNNLISENEYLYAQLASFLS